MKALLITLIIGILSSLVAAGIAKDKENTIQKVLKCIFSIRNLIWILAAFAGAVLIYIMANHNSSPKEIIGEITDWDIAVAVAGIFSAAFSFQNWKYEKAFSKDQNKTEDEAKKKIDQIREQYDTDAKHLEASYQKTLSECIETRDSLEAQCMDLRQQLESAMQELKIQKDTIDAAAPCRKRLQCTADTLDRTKLISFNPNCIPNVKLYGEMRPLVPSLPYEFVLEDGYSKAFGETIRNHGLDDFLTWKTQIESAHRLGKLYLEELPFVFLCCDYTPLEIIRQTYANLLRRSRGGAMDGNDKTCLKELGGEKEVAKVVQKGWRGGTGVQNEIIGERASHYFPHFEQLREAHGEFIKALRLMGPIQGIIEAYARTAICRLVLERIDGPDDSQANEIEDNPEVHQAALEIFLRLIGDVPCYGVNVEDIVRAVSSDEWKASARYPFTDFAIIRKRADENSTSLEVWDFYANSHVLLVHGRKPMCAADQQNGTNCLSGYELLMNHVIEHVKSIPVRLPYQDIRQTQLDHK